MSVWSAIRQRSVRPARRCLAVGEEQKPISSDDSHVIRCSAALYLGEKAALPCHSGTGGYLLLSQTQREAEILAGWLSFSLFTCSYVHALQYTEMLKVVSVQIRIIVLFLILFLNQREKRSIEITFWRARARQMCRIAPRAAGSPVSWLSRGRFSGAEHKPTSTGTSSSGVKGNGSALTHGLSCYLRCMNYFFIYCFLKNLGSWESWQFECWVYQGVLWRDGAEIGHCPAPAAPRISQCPMQYTC